MSVIVVGLGNPLLGDDAAGWRVIEEVEHLLRQVQPPPEIELRQASLGGISLMEMLVGYSKAIVVDAIADEACTAGRLQRLTVEDLTGLPANSVHTNSAHDISFQAALCLGKKMGVQLPSQIIIIAVGITPQFELCEEMSPAVATSVLPAARQVLAEVFAER